MCGTAELNRGLNNQTSGESENKLLSIVPWISAVKLASILLMSNADASHKHPHGRRSMRKESRTYAVWDL